MINQLSKSCNMELAIFLVLTFLFSYVLIFLFALNELKKKLLILIDLKLIQGLKNSVRCIRSHTHNFIFAFVVFATRIFLHLKSM